MIPRVQDPPDRPRLYRSPQPTPSVDGEARFSKMAYCRICGRNVSADERLCRSCGAVLPQGTDLPPPAALASDGYWGPVSAGGPSEESAEPPSSAVDFSPVPPPPPPINPPGAPDVRRSGPSRALVIVATFSLAAVVVLSVLLARRQPSSGSQPNLNTTQIALSSALQAGTQVYNSNSKTFPSGQNLLIDLQRTDPELSFAFGFQSVPMNLTSGPFVATGISVAVSTDGQVIMLAAQASDGTCWYATSNHETKATAGGLDGGSTTRGTSFAAAGGQLSCTAGDGLPSGATPWRTSWPTL